ncbi:hypothetical protein BH09MYX1_BH09MYX1_37170 [soil metagenome]
MVARVTGREDEARAQELDAERELVERARSGDRNAMGAILKKHGPSLYRHVLLPRLGSEAAAQDALSEVYKKVVERIGQFQWQGVGIYPWLRTMALRVALDQLRARKRIVIWEASDVEREVDEQSSATPVDQLLLERRDREEARKRVEVALGKIHARYAKALRLRVLEERPREEVAKTMEVTPATFDVLLHRAVAALRKVLQDSPDQALERKDGSDE